MLFAILAWDKSGTDAARAQWREGHLDHFRAHKAQIALSGPLGDADGIGCGSLVIYTADSEAQARAFIEADPYFAQGVWDRIDVRAFKASIVNPDLL